MDCSKVNLKIGSKGAEVKELQRYLTYLRYYDGLIDGVYGEYTKKAVQKMQKAYGNDPDGLFGPKTCKKCGINGQDISNSIQVLTLSTYKNMLQRYKQYKQDHKKEPNICYIDISNKYRYVTVKKFKECISYYEAFVKKNNREPSSIPLNPQNMTENVQGGLVAEAKKVLGDFKNAKECYNRIKGRGYIGYNNDVYSREEMFKRIKQGKGANCSDWSQLLHDIFIAMGYKCRYVHVMCKSGIGHIQLDVKYPLGVSTWTRIDPAAAASKNSQYSWGRLWCASPRYVIGYDPAWLMLDDGKT